MPNANLLRTGLLNEFEEWRGKGEFVRAVDEICGCVDSSNFFGQGNQWLRDAYLAAQFARLTKAERVRLVRGDRPDFEVELRGGKILQVESTEAMEPSRRRGDELRAWGMAGGSSTFKVIGDWSKNRNRVVSSLAAAVLKKSAKANELKQKLTPYPDGTNLFVYLNISTFGEWEREIVAQFPRAVAEAKSTFPVVWILWNGKLWRIPVDRTAPRQIERRETHNLGWAIDRWRSMRALNAIFATDRVRVA